MASAIEPREQPSKNTNGHISKNAIECLQTPSKAMPSKFKAIPELPQLLRKLAAMRASDSFPGFIEHVRFPRYRNLVDGARLNLDFPVTALVGSNGSGKTSVLQALYGCPSRSNVGALWFSTELDPIQEGDGQPNCFLYGYRLPTTKRIVEILKTRISKDGDPNYWEPSRPIANYGMEMSPDVAPNEQEFRSQTRWKALPKKVSYLDNRRTIGAFDRYFWLGGPIEPGPLGERKAKIRRQSPHLLASINIGAKSHIYYRRDRIQENRDLTDAELSAASFILGRKYSAAKFILHEYYSSAGPTILLLGPAGTYSDAFAGSGETAVFLTVIKIIQSSPASLILLDEPEASLHPGAQERLLRFVLNEAVKHGHQVVFTTHSPHLIKDFPPEAIKVIRQTDSGKFEIIKIDSARTAFQVLQHTPTLGATILVEDVLAAEFLRASFRQLGITPNAENSPSIQIIPGGSGASLKHIYPSHFVADGKAYLLLDGDVFKDHDIPSSTDLAGYTKSQLNEVERNFSGVPSSLPADGGNDQASATKSETRLRNYLNYCRSRVGFLPGLNPEQLLLEALLPEEEVPEDAKNWFLNRTRIELGRLEGELVTSAEILTEQTRLLTSVLNRASPPAWWESILQTVRLVLNDQPLRPKISYTKGTKGVQINITP